MTQQMVTLFLNVKSNTTWLEFKDYEVHIWLIASSTVVYHIFIKDLSAYYFVLVYNYIINLN